MSYLTELEQAEIRKTFIFGAHSGHMIELVETIVARHMAEVEEELIELRDFWEGEQGT